MSLSVNHVVIAGNLTRDPEVRAVGATGNGVTVFSLAVNRRYKQGDEWKAEVSYIDCESWGTTGKNVAQYLTKGSSCIVQGHLKMETWDDKATGAKRSKMKVVADQVSFLDKPGAQADAEAALARAPKVTQPAPGVRAVAEVDEPPFAPDRCDVGWA